MLIFVHFTKAEGVKAGFTKLPAKFLCAQFSPGSSQIYWKLNLTSTICLRGFSPSTRTAIQPLQSNPLPQDELSLFY